MQIAMEINDLYQNPYVDNVSDLLCKVWLCMYGDVCIVVYMDMC